MIGVVLFPCAASNGTCHSSLPSDKPRPTRYFPVNVTTCFVPWTVITTGEEFAGPLPSHFHFGSPLAKSNARNAPLVAPPTATTHRPSTTRGDIDASVL